MGPRTNLGPLEKKKNLLPPPGFDLRFLGRPHCILVITQATLFPQVKAKYSYCCRCCCRRRRRNHQHHVFALLETTFHAIGTAEMLRKIMRYVLQHVVYNTVVRIKTINKKTTVIRCH